MLFDHIITHLLGPYLVHVNKELLTFRELHGRKLLVVVEAKLFASHLASPGMHPHANCPAFRLILPDTPLASKPLAEGATQQMRPTEHGRELPIRQMMPMLFEVCLRSLSSL